MQKRTRYILLTIAVIITLGFAVPAVNSFIGSPNTTVEVRGGFKVDSGGIELPLWDTTKKFSKGMSITNGVLVFNSADNNLVYLKSGVWTSISSSSGVTSIATTSPITGGPITGTGTIAINNAAADGATKGAAAFTAADFNSSAGLIGIDYTNGQAASALNKGFLTAADWLIFNAKGAGSVVDVIGGTNILITGTSTLQPTVNITGTIAVANGGTGTTVQTSVNTTPIVFGTNNSISVQIASQVLGLASGIATWLATSTSANLIAALTDEIGNGKAVFFPDDTTISAAYTLTSRDLFRAIHCTNGSNIALTVPSGLGTTFKCEVIQEGAGTVTPTASGTTLTMIPTGTTTTKQAGSVIVIRSWATANTYTVQGDLD